MKTFEPAEVVITIRGMINDGLTYHQAWSEWFRVHGVVQKVKPGYSNFDWSI
jgi:hypothetical protein